jgi:hypothetical protein
MVAAGNTSNQVKIVSYDPATVMSGTVTATPTDNIYEGSPVYINSSSAVNNASGTTKANGLAMNACTYAEAGGTFGADGNHGQQVIAIAKQGRIINVTGTAWTVNTAIYVNATCVLDQTSGQKIGMAIGQYEAVFDCSYADF